MASGMVVDATDDCPPGGFLAITGLGGANRNNGLVQPSPTVILYNVSPKGNGSLRVDNSASGDGSSRDVSRHYVSK